MSVYCAWFVYGALTAIPLGADQPDVSNTGRTVSAAFATVLSLVAVGYSAMSTAQTLSTSQSSNDPEQVMLPEPDEVPETNDAAIPVTYNYTLFHVVFSLASMYLVMVVTSWALFAKDPSESAMPSAGQQSYPAAWAKAVSSWVALLLYIWSMIAPVVLTNREF